VDIVASLEDIVEMATAWIVEIGEVLAIARYSRAGGNRDYRIFSNASELSGWACSLPPDCNLLVLKDYQLNLRGDASKVAEDVPFEAEVEWLVLVSGGGYLGADIGLDCWGTAEVKEVLADYGESCVIAGRMPAWNPFVPDHAPAILSAIVPRSDGTIHRGVY
jgi:hypothetical protein